MKEEKNKQVTITFRPEVLKRLGKVNKGERGISKLVNIACLRAYGSDEAAYRELAKFHNMEAQKYKYLAEQAKDLKLVKT